MAMVQLLPVRSSQLDAVGYDPGRRELLIRFRGRTARDGTQAPPALYRYHDVPPELHAELLAEEAREGGSVGAFFHARIRNGGFDYQKMAAANAEEER
ncbi:MAG TPA: KTSC domain-containing protein [Stellaceae bacterium]|nr:KTSC domain-containing protein [Stellaceae bacterium]